MARDLPPETGQAGIISLAAVREDAISDFHVNRTPQKKQAGASAGRRRVHPRVHRRIIQAAWAMEFACDRPKG